MNLFEALTHMAEREASASPIYGVVIGIVANNQDPDSLGRIKVKFPWLSATDESFWARVATQMAGKDRGLCCLPEPDDEVLVAFEHGDARCPYIVGALWNGKDTSRDSNKKGQDNIRVIKSRSGHIICISDENANEKIQIIDRHANNSIILDTTNNTITIKTDKDITLSAANGTIKLDAQKIEFKSSADTKIEAGAGMDVKASATMNIKGQTVNIN